MAELPSTRASLLLRLRDAGDGEAWAEFIDVYAPLVHGYARRHGLQDADAADLTQDVLRAVAGAAARFHYDPARGSFRSWLFTLVRNRLRNFLSSAQQRQRGAGDTAGYRLDQHPAPDDEAFWEQEHRRRVLAWAAGRVRASVQESTWLAFWRTAVEGQCGRDVAADLGLSVAAVYLARARVLARLKQEVRLVEE